MAGEQQDNQESYRKIQIRETKQVLVEGLEEVRVFSHLASQLSLTDVQCHSYQGKMNLTRFIRTFLALPDFAKVRSLAVVADADFDIEGTRTRIRHALQNAGLPQPSAPLTEASEGHLRVSYLILPHLRETGMLEDVCLESVKSEPVMECVEQFMECVKGKREDWPKREAKAKARVHAYLASQDRTDLRLGEAAEKGIWNYDSDAFNPLKELLSKL